MTIERIRNYYNAQPFQPFVIRLDDGRHLSVSSREYVASAPNGRTIAVYQTDSTITVIDLLLVTALEIRPPSNGARRRKR